MPYFRQTPEALVREVNRNLIRSKRRSGPRVRPVEQSRAFSTGAANPDEPDPQVEVFDGFAFYSSYLLTLGTLDSPCRVIRIARLLILNELRPGHVVVCGAAALPLLGCTEPTEWRDFNEIIIARTSGRRGAPLTFPAVVGPTGLTVPELTVTGSGRRIPEAAVTTVEGLRTLTRAGAIAWAACVLPEQHAFTVGSILLRDMCDFNSANVPASRAREEKARQEVMDVLAQAKWKPRIRARRLIRMMDAGCGSVPELLMLWAFRVAGLHPETQLPIPVPGRENPYVVDFAFVEERLIVEFDGWSKSGQHPDEIRRSIEADQERQHLIEDQDWEFERFRLKHLADMDALVARVVRRLERIRSRETQ